LLKKIHKKQLFDILLKLYKKTFKKTFFSVLKMQDIFMDIYLIYSNWIKFSKIKKTTFFAAIFSVFKNANLFFFLIYLI
jgi:hypothetical protein